DPSSAPASKTGQGEVEAVQLDRSPPQSPGQAPVPGQASAAGQAPAADQAPATGQAQAPKQAAGLSQARIPSLDDQIERTGCATCGGCHSSLDGPLLHGCLTCGGGPNCVPGQKPCFPPPHDPNTAIGAFCQNLYECLCCPDPCYQPTWVPAANA